MPTAIPFQLLRVIEPLRVQRSEPRIAAFGKPTEEIVVKLGPPDRFAPKLWRNDQCPELCPT